MNKLYHLLLCLSVCFFARVLVRAQMSGTDIFLQGRFLEAGIAGNGTLGSGGRAPAYYHSLFIGKTPEKLALVADPGKDGWGAGSPMFIGDYLLPGTPQEEWSVQLNGFNARAARILGDTAFSYGLKGHSTSFYVDGDERVAEWSGTLGGNIEIRQRARLHINRMFVFFELSLINTSGVKLSNIYYSRSCDADNEVEQLTSSGYATRMKLESKLPNAAHCSSVSATGNDFGSYLGMMTRDCRAKAFFMNSGLISTPHLDSVFDAIGSEAASYKFNVGDSTYADVGMGLVFKLGNLAPNDSVQFAYAYVLDKNDQDYLLNYFFQPTVVYNGQRFRTGDTVFVCSGNTATLRISAAGHDDWRWAKSPYLTDTSGKSNVATASGTMVHYAYRPYAPSCGGGKYDSIKIVVAEVRTPKPIVTRTGVNLSVPGVYASYEWFKGDTSLGIGSTEMTMLRNGNYYVKVTDKYGCVAYSDTVEERGFTGISEQYADNRKLQLFPNPVVDILHIEGGDYARITITNVAGAALLSGRSAKELNVSALVPGVYFVHCYDENDVQQAIGKFVKMQAQ